MIIFQCKYSERGENVYKTYKKDRLVAEAGSLEELYVSTIFRVGDFKYEGFIETSKVDELILGIGLRGYS